jgi:hypothetical protein
MNELLNVIGYCCPPPPHISFPLPTVRHTSGEHCVLHHPMAPHGWFPSPPQWWRWNTAPAVVAAAMKYGSRILLCHWQFIISHLSHSLSLSLSLCPRSIPHRWCHSRTRTHSFDVLCHVFFTYTTRGWFDSSKRYWWFIIVSIIDITSTAITFSGHYWFIY